MGDGSCACATTGGVLCNESESVWGDEGTLATGAVPAAVTWAAAVPWW